MRGAVSAVRPAPAARATPARAQYTANIQGIVEDPSAAGIANAKIDVVNLATQVSATTTSDASGNYRFLSLAPGSYKVTAEAQGFKRGEKTVTLQTNQTLNLPITLEVGALTETVTVTGAPLVNAAETRNQLTLETDSLSDLPLYADNDRVANYNGITFDLRGRAQRTVLRCLVHALELEGRHGLVTRRR